MGGAGKKGKDGSEVDNRFLRPFFGHLFSFGQIYGKQRLNIRAVRT